MNLQLTVEALPGAHVAHVAEEMAMLASRLNTDVVVMFNGVRLVMRPGGSPERLVASYYDVFERKPPYPMAIG
jgi:hypothetical protein